MNKPDKYVSCRAQITSIFQENRGVYGYRRIYLALKREGVILSEKIIRRIMKEEELIVLLSQKRKYSSYLGEITPEVENIVSRDFHADQPYEKLLTDITEFSIPSGKLHLSAMIDCFDGMVVGWTIGIRPQCRSGQYYVGSSDCRAAGGLSSDCPFRQRLSLPMARMD